MYCQLEIFFCYKLCKNQPSMHGIVIGDRPPWVHKSPFDDTRPALVTTAGGRRTELVTTAGGAGLVVTEIRDGLVGRPAAVAVAAVQLRDSVWSLVSHRRVCSAEAHSFQSVACPQLGRTT